MELISNHVIVTGGAHGIGRGISEAFMNEGASVVLADIAEDQVNETANELTKEYDGEALAVECDVTDHDDVQTLIETTEEKFGTPTILVNNAGANISEPPLEMTDDEVETMFDVNVQGLFMLTKEFGRAFRDSSRDSGRVINISSVIADLGVPTMTVYGGTKAAVRGITKGMAAELAPDGITVNSISPGLIRNERTEKVMEEHGDELFDYDRIPLGRVGEVEDVANTCLFLASDLADYITGEDFLVDGGVEFTAGLYK